MTINTGTFIERVVVASPFDSTGTINLMMYMDDKGRLFAVEEHFVNSEQLVEGNAVDAPMCQNPYETDAYLVLEKFGVGEKNENTGSEK